jgi:membrane protein
MKPRHPATLKDHSSRRSNRGHPGEVNQVSQDELESQPGRGRSAETPKEIPAKGWRDILWRTKEAMKEDNLSIVAAGVAFYIFLGIIPALGALISTWGLMADPATIQRQVESMAGFLPQDAINILGEQMTRIAQESTGASFAAALGILLALWSGAKAMKTVMLALNITYEEEETRGFIRLNLTALALTLAGIVGFMVAVGVIVALPIVLDKVGLGEAAKVAVSVLRWPLLATFAIFGLSILYRYAPDRDAAQWRWVSWGAVVATTLWLLVSAGFSFYVSNFGNYNKTYGSMGAVVVLLLWFLITAYVALLGAELNSEMEHQTAEDTTDEPPMPRGKRNAYVADHLGPAKNSGEAGAA